MGILETLYGVTFCREFLAALRPTNAIGQRRTLTDTDMFGASRDHESGVAMSRQMATWRCRVCDASLVGSRPSLFATRVQDGRTYLDTLFDVRETDTSARPQPPACRQPYLRGNGFDGKIPT